MGFNIYKEIPKVKEYLKDKGFTKNIPDDDFGKALMILFGMKKETVRKWINYFEENDIIKIEGDKVNFLWKIGKIVILKQNMIIVN